MARVVGLLAVLVVATTAGLELWLGSDALRSLIERTIGTPLPDELFVSFGYLSVTPIVSFAVGCLALLAFVLAHRDTAVRTKAFFLLVALTFLAAFAYFVRVEGQWWKWAVTLAFLTTVVPWAVLAMIWVGVPRLLRNQP